MKVTKDYQVSLGGAKINSKSYLSPLTYLIDPQGQAANPDQSVVQEDVIDEVLNGIQKRLLQEKSNGAGKLYNRATKGSFLVTRQTLQHMLEQRSDQAQNLVHGQRGDHNEDLTYEVLACEVFKLLSKSYKFFVPLEKTCGVADKYWGSINTLFTVYQSVEQMSNARLLTQTLDDCTALSKAKYCSHGHL